MHVCNAKGTANHFQFVAVGAVLIGRSGLRGTHAWPKSLRYIDHVV